MTKKVQVQTPGEPTKPTKTESDAPEKKAKSDEVVSVPKSMLEAMQKQIDDLAARVASGPRPAQKSNDADLPHPDTIDTALIKSPVLSRHGWVVPDKFGSNAAQPKG